VIRRVLRVVLTAALMSPGSALVAHQWHDTHPDKAKHPTLAAHENTTTSTTPTTLITTQFAATDLTKDKYSAFGLTFSRPMHWRAQTFGDGHNAGTLVPIVYLSADELSDPCSLDTDGHTLCGWPLQALTPNNPLVTWSLSSDPAPPPNTLIGGQPARVGSAKPGACSAVQGTETIVAAITRPSGGVLAMQACLAGDQIAVMEQNIYAMLGSVTVS
jgi:hypothetical protein